MKKSLLSLILLLFTLTSLSADKIKRDKNDPLQNLKIGDKFTISKTTTDTETTFDFTGLGIDDSMVDKIYIAVNYYKDNELGTTEIFNIYLHLNKEENDSDWTFYYYGDIYGDKIENITSSYLKQTIKHTDKNRATLTAPIGRVSLTLAYLPKGRKLKKYFYYAYTLKGINDGIGTVQVVGYIIKTPYGGESKGDVFEELPLKK